MIKENIGIVVFEFDQLEIVPVFRCFINRKKYEELSVDEVLDLLVKKKAIRDTNNKMIMTDKESNQLVKLTREMLNSTAVLLEI